MIDPKSMTAPLLRVSGLKKHFPIAARGGAKAVIHAVGGVSFEIAPRETLSLVGESGPGKSTIGRLVMRLIVPTAGEISFEGKSLDRLSTRELRAERSKFQMIFQDPFGSLNPLMKVGAIVAEPLRNARPDLSFRHDCPAGRGPRGARSAAPRCGRTLPA